MISARQIRAARALLDWSQDMLAEKTGITDRSISNIEKGKTEPRGDTADALQRAFEDHGVEFLPNDGVRMKDESITVLEGDDANEKLLEDVFRTLRDRPGEEILIGGLREPDPDNEESCNIVRRHLKRLKTAGITERLLVEEGDTNFIAPAKWYRWMPKEHFSPVRFQLYGEKLAMVSMGPPRKIIIISSPLIADSYRSLFDFAWKHSTLPDLPGEGRAA
jgi:transcriptional regulator with XRE-family HTH domain